MVHHVLTSIAATGIEHGGQAGHHACGHPMD